MVGYRRKKVRRRQQEFTSLPPEVIKLAKDKDNYAVYIDEPPTSDGKTSYKRIRVFDKKSNQEVLSLLGGSRPLFSGYDHANIFQSAVSREAGASAERERVRAHRRWASDRAFDFFQSNFFIKLLVPFLGTILLFFLILGTGSAFLAFFFQGNNIWYLIALTLALLFFVKRR